MTRKESNLLNTESVCERYGISRQTLWRRVINRRFPSPTGRAGCGNVWDRKVLDSFDESIQKKVMDSVRIAVGNC